MVNTYLLNFFISQDVVKISVVKFDEPSVIYQICQGFPPPKICAIRYIDFFNFAPSLQYDEYIIMLHVMITEFLLFTQH